MVWFLFVFGLHSAFAALLFFGKWNYALPLLAFMVMTALGLVFSYFQASWFYYSVWAFALVAVLTSAALAIGVRKLLRARWGWPGLWRALAGIAFLLPAGFFANLLIAVPNAMQKPDDAVAMEFPMRNGTYYVYQGGADVPLQLANGHASISSQMFALDIAKLGPAGHAQSKWLDMESSPVILGEPVYAPCSGEVVWARDGIPDDDGKNDEQPAGNVVGIACKGVIVSLAHLAQGTVTVVEGDRIDAGKPLGTIGTSGRSTYAHLHMHAERGPFEGDISYNPAAAMTFDDRLLYKGALVRR